MAAMRGLRSLAGSAWVEKVAIRGYERSFAVAIAEETPLDPAVVGRRAGRPVVRIDAVLTGDLSEEATGTWLTCRGSGTRVRLANRPSAGPEEAPQDVLAALREGAKKGGALFEVAGELREGDGAPLLLLTGARRIEAPAKSD